ncbi:hypothetical protein IVG45_00665 [Methylomonas sp. LL1]|uniref:hypothetical protein n=1 Tax=Methylomonas sp. LL1 TaxID=2785785 RepID=UPI0018C38F91|nr:hypothetical protein [Methylomonas sp. LL1]QPK63531.1 hypothetical protein IVG45_00665 [Methylomonas sp. LL1]
MATKKKSTAPTRDKNALCVGQLKGESPDKALARAMSMPETQAALTIRQWQDPTLPENIGINETLDELSEQAKTLKAGCMDRAEGMLLAQAHTLDELFNHLARKAYRQEYISNYESFLKLAFKAQNQCRMTLETLSNIKNPPVVYAKQANISNGPQQVNNGMPAQAPHVEEIKNQPNELLEVIDGTRLDTGTTQETI